MNLKFYAFLHELQVTISHSFTYNSRKGAAVLIGVGAAAGEAVVGWSANGSCQQLPRLSCKYLLYSITNFINFFSKKKYKAVYNF